MLEPRSGVDAGTSVEDIGNTGEQPAANTVPQNTASPISGSAVLGWNPASSSEAGRGYLEEGGYREEYACESAVLSFRSFQFHDLLGSNVSLSDNGALDTHDHPCAAWLLACLREKKSALCR